MEEFAQTLGSAFDMLPEITERKKRNETHMNILDTLSQAIKTRRLDDFHQIENSLMKTGSLDKEDQQLVQDLLSDKVKRIPLMDKLRLFIIYIYSMGSLWLTRQHKGRPDTIAHEDDGGERAAADPFPDPVFHREASEV